MKQTLKDFFLPFIVIILILVTLSSCNNKSEMEEDVTSEEISNVEIIDSYELNNNNLYVLVYNNKDTVFVTEGKYSPFSASITIK